MISYITVRDFAYRALDRQITGTCIQCRSPLVMTKYHQFMFTSCSESCVARFKNRKWETGLIWIKSFATENKYYVLKKHKYLQGRSNSRHNKLGQLINVWCYGVLTPTPGSFGEKQVIYLRDRLNNWGRGEGNKTRCHDQKDVRIPRYAIKMTFWAPGVEKYVANGGHWTQVPGIRTLVHTGATLAILVNGCKLKKESEAGDAVLYGEVHTGDVITIYQGEDPNEFLRYRVEIFFGDGARHRTVEEQPFQILQETKYHGQA